MSDHRLSEADIRRSRQLCTIAAIVFAVCGLGILLLPVQMAPALRGVGAGFNLIIALAVFLYGRQIKNEG